MEQDRIKFDGFVKKNVGLMNVDDTPEKPANSMQFPMAKPTLYEYFFDRANKVWMAWHWVVPEYKHDRIMNISDILVPTVDTLQTFYLLSLMNSVSSFAFNNKIESSLFYNNKFVQINIPVLLVGDRGTAKTSIMSNYLKSLNPDKNVNLMIYKLYTIKMTN